MTKPWRLAALFAAGVVFAHLEPAAAETPPPATECPVLGAANSRLQARAEVLLKRVPALRGDEEGAERALGIGSANLAVALANVIAARAKEEARIWLMQQLSTQICTSNAKGFFSNTCAALPADGEYPGPSLTVIRTQLRRDIYAFPACFAYTRLLAVPTGTAPAPATVIDPEQDAAIDAYVFEAALVGVYYQQKKDTPDDNFPTLDQPPDPNILARLIIGAVYGRLLDSGADEQEITFRRLIAEEPKGEPGTAKCKRPKASDLTAVAVRLEGLIKQKATPEQVVAGLLAVLKERKIVCEPIIKELSALSATYFTAVRGDYVEAALTASDAFLCNSPRASAGKICPRLPMLGEVAAAKDQQEMEAALDRLISPLGAWRRKQSERVVSLQSMAGVAGGFEKLKDNGSTGNHSTYGLYLPIGVEASWPLHSGIVRSVAVGLTALDLGAVVSYSEKDDLDGGQTSSSANTDFSSLTSPGVYVAVGFKDSPFRAGLSVSRTPELRSTNFNDGTEKNVDSTRLMLFFAVDVTLLSF